MYDVIFYTPGSSGLGYLRRFHILANECVKHSFKPLFIFGADKTPDFLSEGSYDKKVLPRMKYTRENGRLSKEHLTSFYSSEIIKAIDESRPSYFICSHGTGINGELLKFFKNKHLWPTTKCIFLFRDIVTSPENICVWNCGKEDFTNTIEKYADILLIAGEKKIFDVTHNYRLPSSVSSKLQYIGYIVDNYKKNKIDEPFDVVISFGSGQHREQFVSFILHVLLPVLTNNNLSVIICAGFYWDSSILNNINYATTDMQNVLITNFFSHHDFISLVSNCKLNIVSGGYNSTSESLYLGKNTLSIGSKNIPETYTRNTIFKNLGLINIINIEDTSHEVNSVVKYLLYNKKIPIKINWDGRQNFINILCQDSMKKLQKAPFKRP